MSNEITIQDRQELIYLLTEAAELEHGLCCSYLFAAFSLKAAASEELSAEELAAVTRWKQTISGIAAQEMLHLALANNLLTALGTGPHFRRPNFPVAPRYYPPEIQLQLRAFSEETLEHFIYIERPEDLAVEDAASYHAQAAQPALVTQAVIVPTEQEYATVNHLYRGIEANIRHLVDKYGEERVFIGPARAQASTHYFQFDGLAPVTDLASAVAAIDLIVAEGEGDRDHIADSHYGKFVRIREELAALKQQRAGFAPARPVLANPYAERPADAAGGNLIDDPYTARVSELCNAAYETLLEMLTRFFIHAEETEAELKALIDAAIMLMFDVVRPLGEALTTLPAGPAHPGNTAGASFAIYRSGYALPHRHAAWRVLHERLRELAAYCGGLEDEPRAPAGLARVSIALADLAETLGRHSGPRS